MKIQYIIILITLFSCSLSTKEKNAVVDSPTIAANKINEIIDKKEEVEYSKPNIEESEDNSDLIRRVLYKGTLNKTIKISLYINEQVHPCGGNLTVLNVMYKYDNQDKWLLLNVTADMLKKNYCMVEDNFSGVLFLDEDENFLNGYWISPDTKKQYKVELKADLEFDESAIEKLDEILFDDLIFNKNDC
ncbi:MAG: hypothetical protein COA67_03910 [Lutibacter sp.]|nr:MAG: hypothetical protein COA67_03910 [Lutibacter sp.]